MNRLASPSEVGAIALSALALFVTCPSVDAAEPVRIELTEIGRYETAIFDDGAAEIAAYDSETRRVFIVNSAATTVDILDLSRPWAPAKIGHIDLGDLGGGANSVAVANGRVAVAVEANNKQDPGTVAIFDVDGEPLATLPVGALPDMVTFSPNGRYLVVANEGEPADYCEPGLAADPEGTISIVDLEAGALASATVRSVDFSAFEAGVPAGVRIFGPNATIAQDLEPEYVAVSSDSTTAFVSLQENNALAVVDLAGATVTDLLGLGAKDHSVYGYGLDPSDRDQVARINPWPVHGLYQPDTIATYSVGGQTYVVTANEGDARDYDCYSEETRVGDLTLDPAVFSDPATLQQANQLGRLKTTLANGDDDGDGLNEAIFSFGGRSISIWTTAGEQVWDSGQELELVTAALLGSGFNNTDNENGSFDNRSDDKGPEPEALTLGRFRGRWIAFVGLERTGGIAAYDIDNPAAPFFLGYWTNRLQEGSPEDGTAGDLAPESLVYIPRDESPIPRALLLSANEVSGSLTVFSIKVVTDD